MKQEQYTPAVNRKFYPDGRVRQFPGNTIICFCDPDSDAYKHAAWVQDELIKESFADKYTLLPMPSMHMTVMGLLCEEEREVKKWSSKLALDASLTKTDDFFLKTVPSVHTPENFRMEYKGFWKGVVGLSLLVKPADAATQTAIWQYREAISEATGVRFPDFEGYEFHISLAYQILKLDDAEEAAMQTFSERVDNHLNENFGVFNTGQPHLTFFDDMFSFVTAEHRHTLSSRQRDD